METGAWTRGAVSWFHMKLSGQRWGEPIAELTPTLQLGEGRGGDIEPSEHCEAPPCWDMARFVLNCLLSLDALKSIWFKGEHLPPHNLWLPGGLRADSGIFAACSLAVSTADRSLLIGVGSRGQPRDSGDSGGHGQAAAHPLGHPQEHTQGQSLGCLLGHRPSLAFLGLFLPHQGSLCLSHRSKPHARQCFSLAPGCISRHRPRMAASLPALSPGRDTGQVLLYLAPRQRSGASICASWAEARPSRGKGLFSRALSPGQQVLRTGVSGCHGSEHEFCFGLHWVCSLPKGSESGSCCFFCRFFFL